ncbi:class I tRNA ligase family protein, partial [Patescibacteria group bacterium]|nr:class I tRNA ligase family protein [Patescibacteria group bacterium]
NNLKFKINKYREVEEYIRKAAHKSDLERTDLAKEKTGIELKGIKAINPVNNEKVPVWVADYVLASYGSGAIMAVPAHDQRDFEFAETHRIEKKVVIQPITAVECWMYDIEPIYGLSEYEKGQYKELKSGKKRPINYSKGSIPTTKAFVGKGIMIRSKQFDGTGSDQGSKEIIEWLDKNKTGHASVNYRLRDWIFSRQRYWGEPIPIIHCEKCGAVPVPEKDLPVKLPTLKDFKPTGTGESPLAKVDNWVNVKCPECNGPAKRETNTMPNWAGDSWYYLRYCDPKNNKAFADKEILKYWLPVDLYVGGAEHAVLHLLYARFWHKVLYDAKLVPTSEPFQKLRNQGLILGEDNQKMSKSRGNVVNPDDVVNKHGADAFRIYEMFMGPFEDVKPWSTHGIVGVKRFLDKTWLAQEKLGSKTDPETMRLLHQTIKKVSSDIETFSFNTAVSSLMIFANRLMNVTTINNKDYKAFIQLLSPFAPHLAEELWERLGNKESIFKSSWPKYNPKLVKEETFDLVVQINGKVRARVGSPVGLTEETARHVAESDENVKKYLENIDLKKIKVIFIKNKLINYVV